MKFSKLTIVTALSAATLSVSAIAQDLSVGTTVYGPEGNEVGTIAKNENGTVLLDTGTYQVPLASRSFGDSEKGATITVTKEQLNQIEADAKAERAARLATALVEGAAVTTADGVAIGTIETIDGDNIVVAHTDGPVVLLREQFAIDGDKLIALFTAEQLKAAMAS